jgi:hypothetical protein
MPVALPADPAGKGIGEGKGNGFPERPIRALSHGAVAPGSRFRHGICHALACGIGALAMGTMCGLLSICE